MKTLVSETIVRSCQVATYTAYDLTIEALRGLGNPTATYRPSKVTDKNGRVLWKFDKNRYPDTYAEFFDIEEGDDDLIVYLNNRFVFEVIPIKDLPQWRPVIDVVGRETHEGGRSAQALVELKLLIAESEQLEAALTPVEQRIAQIIRQRQAAARAAAEAEARQQAQAEEDRKRREYEARINAILARPMIAVYTAEGQRLTGIPVIGDEWHILPRHKWVVTVESYDPETKTAQNPTEHFQVQKSAGGRLEKGCPRLVTQGNPMERRPMATKRGEVIVEIDNQITPLSLYSRTDIDTLHRDGLNGASRLGVFPMNSDGTVTIVEVVKKGVRDIGRFKYEAII